MPPLLITELFDPSSFCFFTQRENKPHQQQNIDNLSNKTATFAQNICATNVFAPFAALPWSMLLHSGNCQHENSRFDIIVASPIATISTVKGLSTVNELHNDQQSDQQGNQKSNQQQTEQDPLTWIKQAIAEHFPKIPAHAELPFMGGALGYFGYDLGARYEVLPEDAVDDINTPDLKVGLYDWAIIKDNHHNQWWFVSHRLSLQDVITLARTAAGKIDSNAISKNAINKNNEPNHFNVKGDWVSNMDEPCYRDKFTQVQEYLKSGDCYQINLAQRFTNRYQGDEYQAFNQLLQANQSPFSAYLSFDDFKVLSVSPERLLSLDEGNIESKPIKGTIKRLANSQENQANIERLQHSTKDRAENVMIVDLLRNDIGRVSKAGSVKVPRLFAIESFPAVHHLVSTVTGALKPQLHATDLLRASFPGGSITGAPKVRAMEIIDELEPHRRSIYCGSIGYICCTGNMDTSITIRTLVCKDDKIHAWAGGGIVADSTCDSEYQETYAKVSKILPILSNMNNVVSSTECAKYKAQSAKR